MGLFDKKYCDICGEKIGLLGNRKLENGNLCKNCAKKLSISSGVILPCSFSKSSISERIKYNI